MSIMMLRLMRLQDAFRLRAICPFTAFKIPTVTCRFLRNTRQHGCVGYTYIVYISLRQSWGIHLQAQGLSSLPKEKEESAFTASLVVQSGTWAANQLPPGVSVLGESL
jgi:hypothetical protein